MGIKMDIKNSDKTIGIVIPTYNRLENLKILLLNLENQIDQNFYVVISDDGSTDGTKEYISSLSKSNKWKGKIDWIYCGKNIGGRRARTRNIGVNALDKSIELVLFLDSDIIIEPKTINIIKNLLLSHENHIVFGITDWLPKLDLDYINQLILNKQTKSLLYSIPKQAPKRVNGTFIGPELRPSFLFDDKTSYSVEGQWALFLNTGMYIKDFKKIGGFNEFMMGYGYEDMDFGIRCAKKNLKCIYSKKAQGFHIWHSKENSYITHLENQKNLNFILQTHGFNSYYASDIDWSLWWHYSISLGSYLVYEDNSFWIINQSNTNKIQIPDKSWLKKLGFTKESIKEKPSNFNEIFNNGVAFLTIIDSNESKSNFI